MAQNVVSKLDSAEEYIKMLKMNKDIQEQEKAEQRKEREKKSNYKSFQEFYNDMTHINDYRNLTDEERERAAKY